jgi:hypothetical protein
VSVKCCQVEVSATSWSLVQRSSTDCGASLCVIKKPREWGGHGPRWAAAPWETTNKQTLSITEPFILSYYIKCTLSLLWRNKIYFQVNIWCFLWFYFITEDSAFFPSIMCFIIYKILGPNRKQTYQGLWDVLA